MNIQLTLLSILVGAIIFAILRIKYVAKIKEKQKHRFITRPFFERYPLYPESSDRIFGQLRDNPLPNDISLLRDGSFWKKLFMWYSIECSEQLEKRIYWKDFKLIKDTKEDITSIALDILGKSKDDYLLLVQRDRVVLFNYKGLVSALSKGSIQDMIVSGPTIILYFVTFPTINYFVS